ncbi:siderophore-interacting protein [Kineococcus glutinatus]|uniref:Siderophore-interacting protein n=1 Tax=Kineococcus glutinatus TaxID=1070872 RepID=A0ABP9HP65_9ACTN
MSTPASAPAGAPAGVAPQATWARWDITIRELVLLRREHVTPRMLRLTLGGPGIAGFESHLPDEHCKWVFPDPGTGVTRAPEQDGDHLRWPTPFPPTREYTVRRYDAAAGEVDFDVVLHDGGVAATWARTAGIGSTLWVAGPRPSRVVPPEFGFHVLLGDETALPAIGRWLEEVPAGVRGVAAVEVADAGEEQDLRVPEGWTLTWLHRDGAPAGSLDLLGEFAEGVALPQDTWTYVFAAGEAGCLKRVRRWARAQGVGRGQSDIAGYWKRGRSNAVDDVLADPEHDEDRDTEHGHEHGHEHDHEHGGRPRG